MTFRPLALPALWQWTLLTAIGILVLATASGVSFDLGLVMIGLIGFAGIALLIGSIASGIRHRHP